MRDRVRGGEIKRSRSTTRTQGTGGVRAREQKSTTPSYAEAKKRLRERQEAAVSERNSRTSRSGILAGDNLEFYQIKLNLNKIDILPFVISQDWYPKLRTISGKEVGLIPGDIDYKLEVPIHRFEDFSVLCLKGAFGRDCPICEEKNAKKEQGCAWEEISHLNASWRCLYNIKDLKGENDKILIWDASHKQVEKVMGNKIEVKFDNKLHFADLDDGYTIEFIGEKDAMGGGREYTKPTDFDFRERRNSYSDSILSETYALDSLLVVPTYEEVENMFHGKIEDTDEERDEERDEVPAPINSRDSKKETRARSSDTKCPAGGKFGDDWNELEDCQVCPDDTFEDCADAKENGG